MNAKESLLNRKELITPLRAALAALLALICAFTAMPPVAALILCLIGFVLAGYELLTAWVSDIRGGRFLSENLLMILAAAACFLAGRYPEAVLAAILYCALRFVTGRLSAAADRAFRAREAIYDEKQKAQLPDVAEGLLRFYVPGVILVALLLGALPIAFGAEPGPWVTLAAAFLFVFCPCAPLLAVHTAYRRAAALAAAEGAVLESEEAAERLANVNTVVFEKLPENGSRLRVAAVRPAEGLSPESLLMLGSLPLSMEESEEAAAVLEAYGQKPDRGAIALGDTLPGLGTLVHTKGLVISAGNLRMMERLGLKEQAAANGGEEALHIAVQDRYAGSFSFERISTKAEDDPVPAVTKLGLNRLVLLRGSTAEPAQPGVDEVVTAADAEEKALAMEKLLAATFPEETLLYYGPDPALQRKADVGFAPPGAERTGGAWMAEAQADTLARTILLSKKAKAFSWQAMVGVLALKLLLLLAYLLGFIPLWPVVLADCGLALLAALNALRLRPLR